MSNFMIILYHFTHQKMTNDRRFLLRFLTLSRVSPYGKVKKYKNKNKTTENETNQPTKTNKAKTIIGVCSKLCLTLCLIDLLIDWGLNVRFIHLSN